MTRKKSDKTIQVVGSVLIRQCEPLLREKRDRHQKFKMAFKVCIHLAKYLNRPLPKSKVT